MKKSYKDVGKVLDELLEHAGLKERLEEQIVIERFTEIMGETFCKRARATKIERGVLFIEVESSAWRQELFYQKAMIKARLNEALGKARVKEIIFR